MLEYLSAVISVAANKTGSEEISFGINFLRKSLDDGIEIVPKA